MPFCGECGAETASKFGEDFDEDTVCVTWQKFEDEYAKHLSLKVPAESGQQDITHVS